MSRTTLREILFYLLHRATKCQGARFSRTLGGGLTVIVMVYGGKTWLALSRLDILPSSIEFETISSNWPYPIPGIKSQVGKGHSLITSWTNPSEGEFVTPYHPEQESVSIETQSAQVRRKEPSVQQLSFFDKKAPEPIGGF